MWPARLFFVLITISICSVGYAKERIALVIGNADYTSSALVNSVNDAEDIASTLESLGFGVNLVKNATRDQMQAAISEFVGNLNDDMVGLFYYSGHAVQFKGDNYLIPIGGVDKVSRTEDLPKYAVNTNIVLDGLNQSQSNLNFVFLDACRDNPFKNLSKEIIPGLAKTSVGVRSSSANSIMEDVLITRGVSETHEQVKDTKGILVAYSTMPGSVSSDGKGRNSPYTESLLKHISKTNSLAQIMLSDVQQDVESGTSGKQTPVFESAITGRFCFNETNNGCGKAVVNIYSSYLKEVKGIQKLTLPDGSSYEGQVVDGNPHGKGIQVREDGYRYEGEWKDGVSHGKGDMYGPEEHHYHGDWKNDVFDGFGIVINKHGRYEGGFVDGNPNGKGVHTWVTGQRYEGYYKNGKRQGQGKHTWPDGKSIEGIFKDDKIPDTGFIISKTPGNYTYEGYIKNGKQNGKGIKKWANGDTYDGNWVNGKTSGFGVYIWNDTGTRYEGGWQDDEPVNGIFSWKDGSRYEGEWKNGLMHGQGSYTFKNDKSSHTGGWKNGEKSGFGITTEPDGTTLEAEFTNDIPHGNIKISLPNGLYFEYQMELSEELVDLFKDAKDEDVDMMALKLIDMIGGDIILRNAPLGDFKGEFKKSKMTGYGESHGKDGSSYVGEMLNNMAHGQGIRVEADGRRYKGLWVNNKRHGYGIMDWPDGSRYIGNWKNNKFDGKGIGYYTNGARYSGAWKAGKKDGYGSYFYVDGSSYKGTWKTDKKHGSGASTTASGKTWKGTWSNGKEVGNQ
jgi:hypothetical protein